ncbi:Protein of unknown function DUF1399 [Macleaya cordata]|uniref:GRPD C-terminal domain-containing protein n=1 Tax=Macleaya cordata TaxID=56857 RepID=A0A200QSJ8_MACCD|nr:Protein of unknown function DUF1399 [Macleaya cordata]
MDGNFSEKSDSSEEESMMIIRLSIDLVAAARRQVLFLRRVSESEWLHHPPTLLHSIRRYDELWMPLISELFVESMTQMILPPLDVQWVWFCHTLNPASYRLYCESRFSKLIEKSSIFDDENEEYALNRCRDIWSCKYPSEPFDLQEPDETMEIITDKSIIDEVFKHKSLYSKFYKPYMSEIVYLIAARKRYQGFLYLLQKFRDGYSKLVPTLDIQLMWLTHQSYPVVYTGDVKDMEGDLGKVVGVWDKVEDEDVKATKKLWERMFDQPYEKAGATIDEIVRPIKSPVYWETWDSDVNTKYKSLEPRFLLEVCVSMRTEREIKETQDTCLRLRTVRCHRELKIDKPSTSVPSDAWQKMWHIYCEFGTRGVLLELRQRSTGGSSCCKKKSSLRRSTILFLWNELLRAPSLTLDRELEQQWMRAVASITPPTQAPYLFKCVPDRVTDDSGAMISDVILKMNRYRPQEGRWLTRTVLDHAGRECFVLRIRMGSGFWRRGGETPAAVKKEDRIIEVREGSWSYVAGSIGRAPGKVVGTATPKEEEDSREKKASWSLSNGDELTIQWDSSSSSSSSSGFTFNLHNQTSPHDSVRLLKGRKMQYQVVNEVDGTLDHSKQEEQEEEEEYYVTLVRYTAENPNGRATALINWKLMVVEVSPEEDAVVVLLLCMVILRSVTEMKKEDIGGLLVRRRLKQTNIGLRDWGSVLLLHPYSSISTSATNSARFSPHLQPWYWNAKAVMASPVEADHKITSRQPAASHYSPAEGDDKLYKRGLLIIP